VDGSGNLKPPIAEHRNELSRAFPFWTIRWILIPLGPLTSVHRRLDVFEWDIRHINGLYIYNDEKVTE
jgi:hypothetical protein